MEGMICTECNNPLHYCEVLSMKLLGKGKVQPRFYCPKCGSVFETDVPLKLSVFKCVYKMTRDYQRRD